jgi:hypothetical protein
VRRAGAEFGSGFSHTPSEDATVTATTDPPLCLTAPEGWVVRGRNFFSTPDGRFDVMLCEATNDWVAIDWEAGHKAYGDFCGDVVEWCRGRSGGRDR